MEEWGVTVPKLSWEDTAREMAGAAEDWNEWEAIAAEGLEIQWDTGERRGKP